MLAEFRLYDVLNLKYLPYMDKQYEVSGYTGVIVT